MVAFISCLLQHARDRYQAAPDDVGWLDVPYWVAGFAMNQHEYDSAETVENTSDSAFLVAMRQAKGTVCVVDEHAFFYTRLWCCYEMAMALQLSKPEPPKAASTERKMYVWFDDLSTAKTSLAKVVETLVIGKVAARTGLERSVIKGMFKTKTTANEPNPPELVSMRVTVDSMEQEAKLTACSDGLDQFRENVIRLKGRWVRFVFRLAPCDCRHCVSTSMPDVCRFCNGEDAADGGKHTPTQCPMTPRATEQRWIAQGRCPRDGCYKHNAETCPSRRTVDDTANLDPASSGSFGTSMPSEYLYDVVTALKRDGHFPNSGPKSAVCLSDGCVMADRDQLACKEERESYFPDLLLQKALVARLEDGKASYQSDRKHILNMVAGRTGAEMKLAHLRKHSEYDRLNLVIQSRFAAFSLVRGVKAGADILQRYLVALKGSQLRQLRASFKYIDGLNDELVGRLLDTLPDLECLELRDCESLTHWRPMGFLTNLTELSLTGCSRVMSVRPLAALGETLQSLDLSGCLRVTDLTTMSRLVNLTLLNLNHCEKVADIFPLAALTNLHMLHLSGTRVENISPLSALCHLRELDLSSTRVDSIGGLSSLVNLQTLDLTRTKVSEVHGLAALIRLQSLNLSWCTRVTSVMALSALTRLTLLNLNCCMQLADHELQHIRVFRGALRGGSTSALHTELHTYLNEEEARLLSGLRPADASDCDVSSLGSALRACRVQYLQRDPWRLHAPSEHRRRLEELENTRQLKPWKALRPTFPRK